MGRLKPPWYTLRLLAGAVKHRRAQMKANTGGSYVPAKQLPRHSGTAPQNLCHSGRVSRSGGTDRKSTRLNSSHVRISYAVFCLKKKKKQQKNKSQQKQKKK